MYEHVFQFFGLRANPFRVSPDPRFYFSTPEYDQALGQLLLGLHRPQGLIVLTGEPGTGKTTLLNHYLNLLRERQRSSSYVFHPQLKSVELFDCILRDFGLTCESRNKRELLGILNQWLIRRQAAGDAPVVIIDEAQAISVRTLDRLRLLLKLEWSGRKLLQIVLAGQPELEEKLRQPELQQLHRRVAFRCSLLPLSSEETSQYVRSRLASAGVTNADVFEQESLDAMHRYSRGIPRTVNLICEQALIAGYAENVKAIPPDIIRQVAAEFDLTQQPATIGGLEIPAKFRRLVPLRPEVMPSRIAPAPAAIGNVNTEPVILKPAAPGIPKLEPGLLRETEPNSNVEDLLALAPPVVPPANREVAATKPILHNVAETIAKPAEDSEPASSKQLPVGWQGPGLAERFASYRKNVNTTFTRVGKQVQGRLAAFRQATGTTVKAEPTLHHVARTVAKPAEDSEPVSSKQLPVGWQGPGLAERFASYRKNVSTTFTRVGKQVQGRLAAFKQATETAAKAEPTLHHVARTVANPAQRRKLPVSWQGPVLAERFASYWNKLSTTFTRVGKQFQSRLAAVRQATESTVKAEPTLHHVIQRVVKPAQRRKLPVDWQRPVLAERFASYRKKVSSAYTRVGKQFQSRLAAVRQATESTVKAEPTLHHVVQRVAKPARRRKLPVDWQRPVLAERFAWYWKEVGASFVRDLKQSMRGHSAKPVNAPTAAAEPTLHHVVRLVAEPDEDPRVAWRRNLPVGWQGPALAERFVRYGKEIGTSFVRDWRQMKGAIGHTRAMSGKRR